MQEAYALDIEVYRNVFLVGIKQMSTGKIRIFEQSDRSTIDYDFLRKFIARNLIVTFNGNNYDFVVLWYAIEQKWIDGNEVPRTCAELKAISDAIIKRNIKWWDAHRELGIKVPKTDHIDLIEPQPNAFASLKILNGRMHGKWLQDLPYHHDSELTFEEIDKLREYLGNDLAATESLWRALEEPISLREYLGNLYGQDFRSKSDSQIGEAMMRIGVERQTHRRVQRGGAVERSFSYNVPKWAKFETPALQQLVAELRETTFRLGHDDKIVKPDSLVDRTITIGETTYSVGIGGLHSTESNRAVHSDFEYTLIDADVASQYPKAILSMGLFPKSLGEAFLGQYDGIRLERLAAKKVKDKAKDKGMKIALNGIYGKLGSPYSILFAPHLLLGVTLSCQLSILLLVERLEAAGYSVVSANTDGLLFKCLRSKFNGIDGNSRLLPCEVASIIDEWEAETTFSLEFNEFASIYNQSVNSYFAILTNGHHKRKGKDLLNPWCPNPDDYDPIRGQLMKNPAATICSDAALWRIKHGTPISETIRNCTDIRQFVSVIRVSKGATWRDEYLGKVVRYYWGLDGAPILEAEANASGTFKQVPKTEGSRPCMTLPDDLPTDIDYAKYEAETEKILREVGFYGSPRSAVKTGRMSTDRFWRVLPWVLAM